MKVGVTGYRGRLGSVLVSEFGCEPIQSDITKPEMLEEEINRLKPDKVIHCAAYTDVDGCERDVERAIAVNVRGTYNLRTIFKGHLIYLSTDYIFDGKRGPYSEKVRPNPLNEYGLTKLGGEVSTTFFDEPTTIVRMTCLYGASLDRDRVAQELSILKEGWTFAATPSITGNPSYVPHIAYAIMQLCLLNNPPKIINVAGKNVISRYNFACMVAETFGYSLKMIKKTDNFNGILAPHPKKGGLKTNYAEKLGINIKTVHEGLEELRNKWSSLYRS